MRYHELASDIAPSLPQRPLILPEPFRSDTKLVIRLLPAVYRWLDLSLEHGEPDAEITVASAYVRFPEVYDADGVLSVGCRQWIIKSVQDEVERLGLSICVVFGPDDAVAVWPGGKLVVTSQPPEGGLNI